MARSLKYTDGGYVALVEGFDSPEAEGNLPVFDPVDWRFELGSCSWAAKPAALKFDPVMCGLDLEQMGFAPGWAKI